MRCNRMIRITVIVATVLFLLSDAAADPVRIDVPTRIKSAATITTDHGSVARLNAGGWLIPGPEWHRIDLEIRRLQTAETRLTAENKSLRNSLDDTSSVWKWIVGAAVLGFAGGVVFEAAR